MTTKWASTSNVTQIRHYYLCEVPCHKTINGITVPFAPCPAEPLPTSKKLLSFGVYTSTRALNAESLRLISEDAETPSPLVNPFFRFVCEASANWTSMRAGALILLLMIHSSADGRNGQIRSELKSRIAKESSGKDWIGSLDI
ncbi:hypothetical protein CDAR_448481 [Caerostris darwini]|uniref:Uncharacterized protein n=1 Tax=Caerostris darwini TaxID=1538125 RepID=A0AAV4QLB8_9ARAC|nr:hypothetical protein CDAR_448481 [Caerostris darwini]